VVSTESPNKTQAQTPEKKGKAMKRNSITSLREFGANACKPVWLALTLLGLAVATSSVQARPCVNPGIAPPNSQPLGSSYNEWVILALQWYYSPTTDSTHPTQVFGNMVVPPPAGFTGVTVPVTMKVGQWFFVPTCFNTWANTPGDWGYDHPWSEPYAGYPTYEAWVRDVMKGYTDTYHPTCTIDGKPVQNIDLYRMQTGLFDLTVPEDNPWDCPACVPPYDLPAGTYGPCLADGWFEILRPMTPGKHTVINAIGEGQFVRYEITVTMGE
jgi:hypothetical protein